MRRSARPAPPSPPWGGAAHTHCFWAGWRRVGCWAGGDSGATRSGRPQGSLVAAPYMILYLDDLFRHRRRYGITMRSKALQVQGHRLTDAAQRLLSCGSLADATRGVRGLRRRRLRLHPARSRHGISSSSEDTPGCFTANRGGEGVWQGAMPAAPAAPRRRVRGAWVVVLWTGGGSWGWRAPRCARVSGPSGWVWLLTPARRNAPLGSACAAVTALGGDHPHTLSGSVWRRAGVLGRGVAPAPLDPEERRPGGVGVGGSASPVPPSPLCAGQAPTHSFSAE